MLLPTGVRPALADCEDAAAIGPLIGGADAVVHLAGITAWQGLARSPGIDRPRALVAVSSAGIYSRHRTSVAAYRAGEEALRAANARTAIIRPTMIYGSIRDRNVHHVIGLARRYGVLPLIGDGTARIQPIHFRDLAAAVAALIDVGRPVTVDAGGGAPVSLREAGEAIFRCLGRQARFLPVPYGVALASARALDRFRGTRWGERVERMIEDRTVDNTRLVETTGTRPRLFAEGLRDELVALGLAAAA